MSRAMLHARVQRLRVVVVAELWSSEHRLIGDVGGARHVGA
jgi:hypothetical protein